MHKFMAWVKAHPYKTALIVFVIGLLWLWLRSGSSSGAAVSGGQPAGLTAAEVQAATQGQMAQLQQQTQLAGIQAQAQAIEGQQNAQVSIAQLAAQTSQANTTTTTQGQVDIAGLQAQTDQLISTLTAQVAESQQAATTAQTQIQANAYTAIATAPYASADYIAGLQFNNQLTTLQDQLTAANTNLATAQANTAAQSHYADWLQGEINAASTFAAAHPTSPFQAEFQSVLSNYQTATPAPARTA